MWPVADGWRLLPLAFLGLFISVDAAITLVNRVVTDRFGPAVLPGLEFRDGVSSEFRTIVVMPTLLTSSAAIDELIERLEIHYLASPDGDIQFALLSDWTNSATENAADDEEAFGRGDRRNRSSQQAIRTGAARASLFLVSSPAGLERGPGQVDRLGTQARKTA